MKRRMRNRTYGVVRGGQGQPNRLLDLGLTFDQVKLDKMTFKLKVGA